MFRNRSVNVHNFAMTPRADIPRSSFTIQKTHKTTGDAGYLIPIWLDEVLPGDSFNLHMTAFARMSTPLFPLMDNLHLDSFFFFVPNRLVWTNWVKFQGEQNNPADSISYVIPQQVSPSTGYTVNSLQDYFGLPVVGTPAITAAVSHSALPLRCYNLIYNEWFRDENLQNSVTEDVGDGPDTTSNYTLLRRGKRHDYFTSGLPWPQKGGVSVPLPLGSTAPIKSDGTAFAVRGSTGALTQLSSSGASGASVTNVGTTGSGAYNWGAAGASQTGLYADLSTATAATINQLRQAFQTQKLLERDARGGTRYTEIVRSHFGVISPDARLQRPEYLGGTSTPVGVQAIGQTSAAGVTGSTTPLGQLGAVATVVSQTGFTKSFVEHGHIIGLLNIRADMTYQQGLRKLWSRSTRYDFYMPVFAMLGEQSILNKEIYCDGSANDNNVFAYQERWAEYRYNPSQITGLFRSQVTGTLDGWHVAQKFSALPTLNSTFIVENPPVDRVLAVASQTGKQFLIDTFFNVKVARPMPMYSVPGMIDHF
ncbi:MAG: major capsid protein [Microvirus sp.]|nr:MAG: major capsid protein [Microvirus sp.]